jgi:hypothetical protein
VTRRVAALYVETGGVYFDDPRFDPWDETRDARLYDGPLPVIAHPPCNRWAKLGRRATRFQDGGCFEAALSAVRLFGGVLEHPAHTYAWKRYGLPQPIPYHWRSSLTDPGWVIETDQSLYGFRTRKPTWLYYVGPPPPPVIQDAVRMTRGCDSLWSTDRNQTPPLFVDALYRLAASC